MIIVALQAKIVVDNGDTFFNIFNITSTRAVVKITLQHGCGPKITLHDSENIKVSFDQINKIGKFNYVNFPAKYSAYRMGRNMYFLPDYKIMKVGYPRCDSFYKTDIVNKCFREKTIAQELCSSFTDQDKIILYTPTWRPYPYSSVPLSLMNDLDMYEFDSWLRNNNLFLFCTAHPKSDQEGWMTELSRVVFIDKTLHPLFDINKFMMEVDILLNDYSTTSTDFSILKRPQLFYMPDYEFYSSKKGFFEEYRGVLPGREVFSYGEFKDTLKTILKDEDTYLLEFNNVRKKLLQRYYDKKEGKGCEELSNIITDILIDC
jgi:CDP-glycerol glycerophosphotransferase (TagB/SpsB family)